MFTVTVYSYSTFRLILPWWPWPTSALCHFLFRILSKIQSSSLILFQTKIFEMHFHFLLHIWVRVDCRPISHQIYTSTSSNSIRKETGWNEFVEEQLNVAKKNLAKYPFGEKDGNKHLEEIFSMNGWFDKNHLEEK